MAAQEWERAVQAFDEAIQADPRENAEAHLYGMRYGYSPHREKGLALARLARWEAAIQSLEESLRQGYSEEAARSLELARRREPAVEPPGVFTGAWWDYHARGLMSAERGLWAAAARDFAAAQDGRREESRFARTYGVHFIEYFPVRELGVALYQMGRYRESVEALERSLATAPTAKAAYYLNLARAALLRQSRPDSRPPRITIDAPEDGLLTNVPEIEVQGAAESRNFVASVTINGEAVSLERAVPRLHFTETVPLGPGRNVIEIVARDLVESEARAAVTVVVDQEGPVVDIERVERLGPSVLRVDGFVYDNVRLGALTINGRAVGLSGAAESRFSVDLPAPVDALLVEASDAAGNVTRFRLLVPPQLRPPTATGPARAVPVSWPPVRWVQTQPPGPLTLMVDEDLPGEVEEQKTRISWVVQSLAPLTLVKINAEAKTIRNPEALGPKLFSHTVLLREGENIFTITAVDRAGREVARTVKIVRKVEEARQIGRRLAVAVLPLQQKGKRSDLYDGAYDAFENALVNQRRFQIVSRVQLEKILSELKLSQTQLVERSKAVEVGKLANAEAILVGTVNVTDRDVEMWVELVNVETSTVLLANQDVYDPVKSQESFRQKIRELAEKIRHNYPLVDGTVLEVRNQRVAVDLGSQKRVRPEMKILLFVEGPPIRDPRTKVELGRPTDVLGEGVLSEVQPQFSFAEMRGGALGRIQRSLAQGKIPRVITK